MKISFYISPFLATLEYEAELRHTNEMKKLEAKMKAQYVSTIIFISHCYVACLFAKTIKPKTTGIEIDTRSCGTRSKEILKVAECSL